MNSQSLESALDEAMDANPEHQLKIELIVLAYDDDRLSYDETVFKLEPFKHLPKMQTLFTSLALLHMPPLDPTSIARYPRRQLN